MRDGGWMDLRKKTLKHSSVITAADQLEETVDVRVQDFTQTNAPDKAKEVFRYRISLQPNRFEALMATPPERAGRSPRLLEIAQEIAVQYVK